MLKPGGAETFEEYAHQVFIPYISRQLQSVSHLDLVWDRYVAGTLKATARAKCGKGIRQRFIAFAYIPKNWQNFLCVDLNKQELLTAFSQRHLLNQSNTKKNLLSQTAGCRFFVCQHNRILIYLLHAVMKRLTVV